MKKQIALTLISMLTAASAFAGAANADLKCVSKDGLSIAGNVPGDMAEFDVTVSKNGKSARLASSLDQLTGQTIENANLSVVESLADGVWTLIGNLKGSEYGFLEMYALPKTVKFQRIPNGYKAQFTATVRYSFDGLTPASDQKKVACTLKYEI